MNHKYINSKTFEIVDDVFEVDEDIAEAISILNKKGYHTKYCCSGHVKDPRLYESYPLEKVENKNLGYIIDDEKILMPYTCTTLYIMFDKEYNFPNIPANFIKDDNVIECFIDYYDNDNKKSSKTIDEEIKHANTTLLNWVKSLPKNI